MNSQLVGYIALQDGISSKDLVVPELDVGVAFEHLGILTSVWAASELNTGANVLEATSFVALVIKFKVDAGAVLGCCRSLSGGFRGRVCVSAAEASP
jgi:hypothetical protein